MGAGEGPARGPHDRYSGDPAPVPRYGLWLAPSRVEAQGGRFPQVMIETPWTLQHNRIRLGEPVELVVVSDVRNLQRFKVVRDAFLPASQLWISDYPFLARSEMKQLVRGIQVERSR